MNMLNTLRRSGLLAVLATTLALAATGTLAEEPAEVEAAAAAADAEAEAADAEAQLADAKARLEAAAREIAELTAEMMGDIGMETVVRIEEMARRARPVMLGVTIGPAGEPDARDDGVRVLGVTPGSPAEEAGIRSGDILLSLGATRLDWSDDSSPASKLVNGLREVEPGTEIELAYRRDGADAKVMVEARPASWAQVFAFDGEGEGLQLPDDPSHPQILMRRFKADHWGDMELVALNEGLGEYFDSDEGVLVVRAPKDPVLGLQDGDVILDIGGRAPLNPGHVVRILRSYAPGERLVMTVIRHGKRMQLEADVPGGGERR